MSSKQHVTPTLKDKVLLVPCMLKVLAATLYRVATYPFVGTKANHFLKDIVYAAFRQNLGSINAAQEQILAATAATTETGYLELTSKRKVQPETTVLDSGLKLHWLGPKSSTKVMLFFHGGGYAWPCTAGHFQWLFDLQKDLSKNSSISVVIPSYTLIPHAQYPEQLRQAAEALTWLTEKAEKKAGDIVVAGDSAGGNLCLALLSHLLHPHAEIPKINLTEPLATAILISPWVKFGTDDDSFRRNMNRDMLHPKAAARWTSLFLGSKPADEYNEPAVHADAAWFTGLSEFVNDILVWGGSGEVLIDSINRVSTMLKAAHPKTKIVVQDGASHEDFIMDVVCGYPGKGEGTKLVESWLAERL